MKRKTICLQIDSFPKYNKSAADFKNIYGKNMEKTLKMIKHLLNKIGNIMAKGENDYYQQFLL